MKKIIVFTLISMLFSCGRDDSSNSNVDSSSGTSVAAKKLSKIELFRNNAPNFYKSWDPIEFAYDAQGRINKLTSTYGSTDIVYKSDNLISSSYFYTGTNYKQEITTNINLGNNLVRTIVKQNKTTFSNSPKVNMQMDSLVFSYSSDNRLSKLIHYEKLSGATNYRVYEGLDYSYSADGNINRLTRTSFNNVKISKYTYDSTPYVKLSDMADDCPFDFDILLYPVYADKLGVRSKNNIIRVDTEQSNLDTRSFLEYAIFKPVLNADGTISELQMSGKTVANVAWQNTGLFDNVKIIYSYK